MGETVTRLQAKLRERGLDAALIAAPEQLSSVNARYLSGFSGSSCYLVIATSTQYLVTDFRYTEQAKKEAPDFEIVRHGNPYVQALRDLQESQGFTRIGFEADKIPVAMFREWQDHMPAAEFEPLKGLVEELRILKTPEEIQAIRRAAEVADRALLSVIPGLKGRRERDVALDLEMAMRREVADALAFSTIVVSGSRGSLPHGRPSEKVIEDGDLVTIDFGALVNGYHSDETVTVGIGQPSAELRSLFDIVSEAQQAGIQRVRPGVSSREIDEACRDFITKAGYGEQFGHGTGHGVGLQVHEAPFASSRGREWILEAGMTLTVEPGIYIPGIGGVRLEDTLVVTESGSERLTGFPKRWQTY